MISTGDDPVRLEIIIPFRGGLEFPIYIDDQGFIPSQGRVMSLYEFFTNPATASEAADYINQEVRKQTELSPTQIASGFLDHMFQGATLGWSEEAGSYFAGIPAALKGESYSDAVAEYREQQRAQNEAFEFLRPKTTALAQGTGLAIPIGAALLEPTPGGEAAVGAYSTARTATRAFNPFSIAGTTRSATFAESIMKAMVLSAGHSAGDAEGYWKSRLANVPAAMREGFEWGLIANVGLFGTMAAFSGLSRLESVKSKLRKMDFYDSLGKDMLEGLKRNDTTQQSKFRQRMNEILVETFDDGILAKLRTGRATAAEIKAKVDEAFQPLREQAAKESELTLGEMGGDLWKAEQLAGIKGDPYTGKAVRQQLVEREAGDLERVSSALQDAQPTSLLTSGSEALNLRQSRISGTRTDPISGEVYPVEPPGLLGAEPLPLKPTGGSQGVSGIYYQKGYTANDVPLAGAFMKTFRGWKGWEKVYKQAQALRNARIYGPNKESAPYTANGLSNELPAWKEFLDGVRYIPKSTAKDHGSPVKQQLNPKSGLWQEYKNKPRKDWKTRTRVVFDDFKVIEQQKNPATEKWSDVPVGRKPIKGWDTRQKTVGGDWAVRLNDKSVSFETLHDMRKVVDQDLAVLKKSEKMTEFNATAPFRTQLDDAIKANPDMVKADNYFSAFKTMETAAASGSTAWNQSLPELMAHYTRMGTEQKRMFRTAMLETARTKGFSSTELTGQRIGSDIADVPDKIRMLFPEGAEGQVMYNQAMEELGLSARMHETYTQVPKVTPGDLTAREPRGLMKTLSLLAKVPAYKFSMEFALGRDLINRARTVDKNIQQGMAREVNRILSTKSGPEAAAMIDELASTAVRMRGNVPAANSLKSFADTLRSVGSYVTAGTEVDDRMAPVQGTIRGTPEGEIDVGEGVWPGLLQDYAVEDDEGRKDYPYDRTYPATEGASSLLENLGVPVAEYLREKVPYWWHGPR